MERNFSMFVDSYNSATMKDKLNFLSVVNMFYNLEFNMKYNLYKQYYLPNTAVSCDFNSLAWSRR